MKFVEESESSGMVRASEHLPAGWLRGIECPRAAAASPFFFFLKLLGLLSLLDGWLVEGGMVWKAWMSGILGYFIFLVLKALHRQSSTSWSCFLTSAVVLGIF